MKLSQQRGRVFARDDVRQDFEFQSADLQRISWSDEERIEVRLEQYRLRGDHGTNVLDDDMSHLGPAVRCENQRSNNLGQVRSWAQVKVQRRNSHNDASVLRLQ